MAIARLDPRLGSRYVDAFASLVGRRESVAPPFRISRRVYFHRGAVANSTGNSSDPGIDAHCRARRSGNSDAAWNSRASRRQSYSREQRPCRRKRGVQRHSFIADVAHDRLAFRRTETTFGVAPRGARRVRCCHRASRQFCPRSFSGPGCSDRKHFRGRSLA